MPNHSFPRKDNTENRKGRRADPGQNQHGQVICPIYRMQRVETPSNNCPNVHGHGSPGASPNHKLANIAQNAVQKKACGANGEGPGVCILSGFLFCRGLFFHHPGHAFYQKVHKGNGYHKPQRHSDKPGKSQWNGDINHKKTRLWEME